MITWIVRVKFFGYATNMMIHASTESEAIKCAISKAKADYGFPNPKVESIREM